jgi:hypothetical protein
MLADLALTGFATVTPSGTFACVNQLLCDMLGTPRRTSSGAPRPTSRTRRTRTACAGCDGYLAKPIAPWDVLAEVQRLLAG